MDTKGDYHEHSKIKLRLYENYLKRFIEVLCNSPTVKMIRIFDIFAGYGSRDDSKKDNGTEGSAVIAIKNLEKIFKDKPRLKKILHLFLNDKDFKYFRNLQKSVSSNISNNVIVSKNMAKEYLIKKYTEKQGTIDLVFLDPFGYTQVEPEQLKLLFRKKNTDVILFLPTSFISRFVNDKSGNNPAQHFLRGLGVDYKKINKPFSVKLIPAIKAKLDEMSKYAYIIKLSERNFSRNQYHLIFTTNHELGADKFLESENLVRSEISERSDQLELDLGDSNILDYMDAEKWYDNGELYKLALKNKIHASKAKIQIKEAEKNDLVKIEECRGQKRKNKGLYISYTNSKERPKIRIKKIDQGDCHD